VGKKLQACCDDLRYSSRTGEGVAIECSTSLRREVLTDERDYHTDPLLCTYIMRAATAVRGTTSMSPFGVSGSSSRAGGTF
jgi:hypothetical protein